MRHAEDAPKRLFMMISHSPEKIAAAIPDGARLMLNKGEVAETPMAVIVELIRRQARDLHIYTLPTCAVPVAGMMVDMMIGAGCVKSIETSGVSFGELGAAPRFTEAVKTGRLSVVDATCPAIYAATQAGGKAQPFTTLRGLIGSDVEKQRPDYKTITNPFDPNDPVVVIKSINPDVTVFHAPLVDRDGNIWVGRQRDLIYAAHASEEVYVTVEDIYDGSFFDDEKWAAGVLPSFYINGIAHVPNGAWPMKNGGGAHLDVVRAYQSAAKTQDGFDTWLETALTHPWGKVPA